MKKKIIIVIGIIIILFAIALTTFILQNNRIINNNNGNNKADISNVSTEVKKGTFEYTPVFESSSAKDTYYYSDDYFSKSGIETNEHLRTMSICLALSATNALDKEDKAENVINLLEELDFENIETDEIKEISTKDTIGSAIGSKEINNTTLIAVSIRGSNYTNEWMSNFTIGEEGDPTGFLDASSKIINRIKEYKTNYNIDDCKLWIVGYSRAGAIANLIGKYVNENLEEFDTSKDDLYIYTFEAPLSSTSEVVYENIHNVINPNDFITYVFPEKWGIYNNGVEEILEVDSITITKNEYDVFSGELFEFLDENDELETIELSEFLDDFVNWITKKNPLIDYSISREKYVMYLEEPFCNLINLYYLKDFEERKQIVEFFMEVYQNYKSEGKLDLFVQGFSDFKNSIFDDDNKFQPIKDYVDAAYETSNVPLTKEELETIENSFKSISKVAIPIAIMSTTDGSGSGVRLDMKITGFYHLATFINHFQEIAQNHYVQNNLKVVQANDSYYNK